LIEAIDPETQSIQALVLVPKRELATQAATELTNFPATRRFVRSSSAGACPQAPDQGAPQPLHHGHRGHTGASSTTRNGARYGSVRYLVLDEADRMLDREIVR
jgi:superfamily II DNA/RNA helicase